MTRSSAVEREIPVILLPFARVGIGLLSHRLGVTIMERGISFSNLR